MKTQKISSKNRQNDVMLQPIPKEIALVRRVAVKLLKKIDKELNKQVYNEEHKLLCDRIFGQKSSLTETLVQLSDLLLRIRPAETVSREMEEQGPPTLNDTDRALVEAFLKRHMETSERGHIKADT